MMDFVPVMTEIHSFVSGMHHYACVVLIADINLQSGQLWQRWRRLFQVSSASNAVHSDIPSRQRL